MNPKFFTVEEANGLIGFLDAAVDRIRRNHQRQLWLQEEISILQLIVGCGAEDGNDDRIEFDEKVAQLETVEREIKRARAAICDAGCILMNEEQGLVDFFSIQNNTVVYLSWRQGEDAIGYWRSIREPDGNERRPLEVSPSK